MRLLHRICVPLYLVALISAARAQRVDHTDFVKTNSAYSQMLTADLTHSNHQDLIYWSQAGNAAWYEVLRNEGARRFSDLGSVPLPSAGIAEATAGDFNEDGKPDLIFVTNRQIDGYVIWFLAGNGDGTFDAPVISKIADTGLTTHKSEAHIFPGRLTGSGHLDLAISSTGDTSIDLLSGDGRGHFSLLTTLTDFPVTLQSVLDVNGDGLADLVTWNGDSGSEALSNSIRIYLNQGDGRFASITAFTNPQTGSRVGIRSVVFTDLDGDGIPDMIYQDSSFIYTVLGNGDGTFRLQSASPFEMPGRIIATLNLDPEETPGLILEEDAGISVIVRQGGSLYKTLQHALTRNIKRKTVIADIDGDGKLDALVSDCLPDSNYGATLLWSLLAPLPTTTTLQASAASLMFGQPLTLTATVAAQAGYVPSGSVTFLNGTEAVGTATLDASGSATITFSPDPGTYSFSASYAGSTTDAASGSNLVKVTVTASPTVTSLSVSPKSAPFGTAVTLTARVEGNDATPVGGVSFLDGGKLLGTATLSGGTATYTTSALGVGTHTLLASYRGLSGYLASNSPPVSETIGPAEFTLTATPASQTVYAGESSSFTVTLKPGTGFNLPVALTCSQIPGNTTCVFTPTTVSAGSTTAKVLVQTSAPGSQARASVRGSLGLTALAGVALFIFPRRWRVRSVYLVVFSLSCIAIGLGGCSAYTPLSGGTPVGPQTITITGTASNGAQSVSHTATLRLEIKSLF